MSSNIGFERVQVARAAVTKLFLHPNSRGIEVGAGTRPFPVPSDTEVLYGDVRDTEALKAYFADVSVVGGDVCFDAQTMHGFEKNSLDFILCGHVIEHLEDPIGSIVRSLMVLNEDGVLIHAVPDMRLTFDRERPETSVAHVLSDFKDGGVGTRRQAYYEHLKYVHPVMTGVPLSDEEVERQATESARRHSELDVHFHAWTMQGFFDLLAAARDIVEFDLLTAIPIENENIFVLKRTGSGKQGSGIVCRKLM